jgi:hypothetical protein
MCFNNVPNGTERGSMNNWFIYRNQHGVHDLTAMGVVTALAVAMWVMVALIALGGLQ